MTTTPNLSAYSAINTPAHLDEVSKLQYVRKYSIALGRDPCQVLLESQQEIDTDFRLELFKVALRGSPRNFNSAKLQSDAECHRLWHYIMKNGNVRSIQVRLMKEMLSHGINIYDSDGVLFKFSNLPTTQFHTVFCAGYYKDLSAVKSLLLEYIGSKSSEVRKNIFAQMAVKNETDFFANVVPANASESNILIEMYYAFPIDSIQTSLIPVPQDASGTVRSRAVVKSFRDRATVAIENAQRILREVNYPESPKRQKQRVSEPLSEPKHVTKPLSEPNNVSEPLSESVLTPFLE